MEKRSEVKNIIQLLVLMALAFAFSVGVRTIWINQFKDYDQFKWNNELMINTNDGYYWAEGARDIINGFHQNNDSSPITEPPSIVTAFLAKVTPVSFETLILWLPAVFGSLLVIPIMLIARALNQEYVGFVAAIFGSIVWSYYNRTMIGYYDTDMLTIVLPTFVLWSLILNFQKLEDKYLIAISATTIASLWWYPQSYSLIMGMAIMSLFYTLVFNRKNPQAYKIIIFILLSITYLPMVLKVVIIMGLYTLFMVKKELFNLKNIYIVLGVVALIVLVTGGFTPILKQVQGYLFREALAADIEAMKFHYYAVVNTVREAGKIPFETFANRISGHTIIFILSVIGYVILCFKYRIMLLALPMVALGFLALKGGLRFTVYAVPIMALGMAFLIFFVTNFIANKYAKIAAITLATIAIIYPNIVHIQNYKVPTVFTKNEVQILDKLKNITSREDYVVTWWDYGYPIRYYSDVKTLVDGGKHTGQDNFAVSFALTKNQIAASNMARLEVEYTEKRFKENHGPNLNKMLKDYKVEDVDKFLAVLGASNFPLPEKTRDIYFYLPNRMMGIFPTVALFSNIDLKSGQQYPRNFFYQSTSFKDQKDRIDLGNGISVMKSGGEIKVGGKSYKLANFAVVGYNSQGNITKNIQPLNKNAPLNVIYMKSYNKFLVLDNANYNSLYVQLFVLENYDKDRFEMVINSPYAKVYKLKI